MSEDLQRRIERAKVLLATARHAALATVNEDGSPHNSPVRIIFHPKLTHLYWASHEDATHSKNISRTGEVFVVLYDMNEQGGLYMKCSEGHILADEELREALALHNILRKKEGKGNLEFDFYSSDIPRRMWGASIVNFWVNDSEKDASGHTIKDGRVEITAKDLLS